MQPYVGSDSYGYISHSYRDKERIDKYIDILQKDGYRFWMDLSYDTLKTAGPGNQSMQLPNIPKMIDGSKIFIVFISNASARSMNIRNEISYAVNSGKEIAVVYLDQCEISDGLKNALAGKKTAFLYKYRTLEESVNEIKTLCPDSIHPVLDTIEDELKELFLTERFTEEESAALVKKAEEKALKIPSSAAGAKRDEYNYYIVLKRLEPSGPVYKALIKDTIMIGRGQPTNGINLDDMYVARLHCQIKLYDNQIFIKDNNSTNHTFCENKLVSSDNFERVLPTGRYRIGRYFYSIALERKAKPSEDSSRTVYYKAMLDEFQEVAKGANQISTKSLLMDDSSLVNQKFNEALKKWNKSSAARYIIDLLCDNLDVKFEKEERHRIYEELNLYSSIKSLSKETYDAIFKLAALLIDFAVEKLKDENASQYIKYLDRYMDPYFIAEKIVEYDNDFVLYYLTPIFDLDEEQLGYILKHVLKRKGIDFYNPSEFLLWVAVKVDTDSRFGLLTELNILYEQLKASGQRYRSTYDDDDIPVTVYIGYNAEENYLDRLDERIELKDVRTSDLVGKMLRWHINLEKKTGSSATVRFYELYKEVNTLYASDIADIKVMKKNMNGSEPAPEEQGEGKRGSYNVSLKYDGSGKIIFKYVTSADVILSAGAPVFESNGRFNRINGRNEFAPVNDVEIKAGSGEITLTVKCISENPFQMAKLRKKGTASIAEKDTITLSAAYALKFDSAQITNKPICIFFEKFTSTGDIREYLYSDVDRKDLLDEWFYGENKLSVDLSLFEAEWFIDSRLTNEIIEKFDIGNGYEQRCGILLMLYMKFCKENFDSEMPYQQLIKKFSKMVDYEMDEIRFDGLSFGNSFDCLLCYLLLTSSPTDNLRLLYKEAFR